MGCFRAFLATVVMIGHLAGGAHGDVLSRHFLNALLAVEVFFAVSGFYMYFIWHERYAAQPDAVRAFYASRFLRIFPTYWIFLALTLMFVPNLLDDALREGNAFVRYHYALENILLLRSDAMTEAWPVSVELVFYALAPFLLPLPTRALLVIIVLSAASRLYLASQGFWYAHYFPLELCLFLSGALLCRYYLRYRELLRAWPETTLRRLVLGFAVWTLAYSIAYVSLPDDRFNLRYGIYLLSALPFIPLLFELTRESRRDRFIGEMSYAIYLGHPFFIRLVAPHAGEYTSLFVIPLTLLSAVLIARFIDVPLGRWRRGRFAGSKA